MNYGSDNFQPNTPQPVYQPAPDPELDALTGSAFGKGLAAAIMAWFPIASIIAIIFGSKALALVSQTRALAQMRQRQASKKLIPAKVLGMVGKIGGIVMTVFWVFYFILIIFVFGGLFRIYH